MLETIEAVRRVSGRNFAVQYAQRRPRDIMTMIADTGGRFGAIITSLSTASSEHLFRGA